ncbi:hypothetical protein GCM10007972_02580 [Iodidimonas muriae]|uniref:Zinc finger CGNR domain-containing protein n=2 Tax=Iodidimonas muriae TaxID=261467 RepID=A0ABQ2L6V9_9PROT|nr:hypothetical protein JCM17843_08800 [Kordiimonadales bacterium JCM 17843]GGO05315.1 hypothetical protein GCM10007972_02580 [Iodidimonas muriae]
MTETHMPDNASKSPYIWGEDDFIGGAVALDFVNSAPLRRKAERAEDRLDGYMELMRWSVAAGSLFDREVDALRDMAQDNAEEVGQIMEQARLLRKGIKAIISACAEGHAPDSDSIAVVNVWHMEAQAAQTLVWSDKGPKWCWKEGTSLARPLWPVAQSVMDLIFQADHDRLRSCGNDRCHWLFLDSSKAGRRRWCSMHSCGNRAKAARYHRRCKSKQAEAG